MRTDLKYRKKYNSHSAAKIID